MIIVNLCLLIASTTTTPQIISVDEISFASNESTEVYRCEYVYEKDLPALLKSKGIVDYQMKTVESFGEGADIVLNL